MTKDAQDAKDFVDNIADKAAVALNSTRDKALDAIDSAEAKANSIRDDLRPSIDALTARVQDLAERTKHAAYAKRDQTKEAVQQCADKTSAYVVEQPLKSIAIAAAAGAVLALLLGRRR